MNVRPRGLIDAGAIRPIVEAVLPLDRAREAYERVIRDHPRGKLVLAADFRKVIGLFALKGALVSSVKAFGLRRQRDIPRQLTFVDVGPLGCPVSSGHGHADLVAVLHDKLDGNWSSIALPAAVLGLSFITEGAIPFAAKDPLRINLIFGVESDTDCVSRAECL